jgi:hypothetical protein
MHRQMIKTVNDMLDKQKQPRLSGWVNIPGPTASGDDAVPPFWEMPVVDDNSRQLSVFLPVVKSSEFYYARMLWWDRQFKDPTYLRQLTLGELGSLIEWSVHNYMHIRWSSSPWSPYSQTVLSAQGRPDADIGPAWDDSRYDWLDDTYSSHVNPIFWKLHGWVDDRVTDWANAHRGEVSARKLGGVEWFEPGKWVQVAEPWIGGFAMDIGEHAMPVSDGSAGQSAPDPRIVDMEKIIGIINATDDPPALSPKTAKFTAKGLLSQLG